MPQRLKVFRTPIGFDDAYVAAPSRKAALAAWGSDADLFARGAAELVTDPTLVAEPLARPGAVIRRSRGTAAEQIAAPPRARPKKAARPLPSEPAREEAKPSARQKAPARKRQRPSRARLDEAEQAIANAERRHRDERQALSDKLATLQKERQRLEAAQARDLDRLRRARDKVEAHYDRALRDWPG
jgi:hypothetical protein